MPWIVIKYTQNQDSDCNFEIKEDFNKQKACQFIRFYAIKAIRKQFWFKRISINNHSTTDSIIVYIEAERLCND
jgi:hypothetical protein